MNNLLTFFKELLHLSRFSAGLVSVLVGYTSSAVIIFQAATTTGASPDEISSWLWALGLGLGATTIGLSLFFKAPVLTAWSTPGAALLITGLDGVSMAEAIGIFMFSSALILICGVTGWFDKLIRHIPQSLSAAMLAGVLLPFGIGLFKALNVEWSLVLVMLFSFLLIKQRRPRAAIPFTLLVGLGMAYTQGLLHLEAIQAELASPIWTTPVFNPALLLSVGIPFFIVTMTSQMMPGFAVMRANNYSTPASPIMSWTGITGILLAPFGGFSFNLAAITAAICMSKEADADPEKRYLAAIWAGILYLLMGIFAATITSLFIAFPQALVASIAGLALMGTLGHSLSAALHDENEREASLITFIVTTSGISLLGIGSAFWGITFGLLAYYLRKRSLSAA